MTKDEILRYWTSVYGPLSPPSKERFLRRRDVARLTRYPDALVKRAIRYSNLLQDAVNFAAILANPLRELPPEPRSTDAPAPAAVRRHDDAALHQRIGPVQGYDRDF